MKKTLLVTLDFPPSVGGISTYWKELSECLPASQWIVLAPKLPKGISELAAPYNIYRRGLLSRLVNPHWLPLFFHIMDIVKRERIEQIVVAQILPVGSAVWLLSKLFHIPYIVSAHGMDVAFLSSMRKKFLCGHILAGASKIVVNSDYTHSVISHYGTLLRSSRVYPCPSITPTRFKHSLEILPQGYPSAKTILLTVSRLVRRKGHEDVILAMQKLRRVMPDLVYVIVGDGPYRVQLEERVKSMLLSDRVLFIGAVSDEEVARWYAACAAVIMVSKDIDGDVEGFGITYLEANAFGKPVIAGSSGGVSEAVLDRQTGLLVSPGKTEEIQDAIEKICANPQLAMRLGEQGRIRVEREFQWSEQAKKLEQLLA